MSRFCRFTDKASGKDVFVNPFRIRTVTPYEPKGTLIIFDENYKIAINDQIEDVIGELEQGLLITQRS